MTGHMADQFIFRSRRLSDRAKNITFGVLAFIIIATFWWFKGVAFGIEGPVASHWGLRWRKVGDKTSSHDLIYLLFIQSWNIY